MQDKETIIQQEVDSKGLLYIINALNSERVIMVSYFEKTDHQSPTPQKCTFGKYVIHFSSAGNEWCGGMRGPAFVSEKYDKNTKQICSISPYLSDYLAQIAKNRDEKIKRQMKIR